EALTIGCDAVFNTQTLAFTTSCPGQPDVTGALITEDAGVPAALVVLSGLQITGTLRVEGANPVIIAVLGDVSIDGTLDVSSGKLSTTPGAGAQTQTACGAHAGQDADSTGFGMNRVGGGGGGGAFATLGTKGGNAAGGDGGTPFSSVTLVPL